MEIFKEIEKEIENWKGSWMLLVIMAALIQIISIIYVTGNLIMLQYFSTSQLVIDSIIIISCFTLGLFFFRKPIVFLTIPISILTAGYYYYIGRINIGISLLFIFFIFITGAVTNLEYFSGKMKNWLDKIKRRGLNFKESDIKTIVSFTSILLISSWIFISYFSLIEKSKNDYIEKELYKKDAIDYSADVIFSNDKYIFIKDISTTGKSLIETTKNINKRLKKEEEKYKKDILENEKLIKKTEEENLEISILKFDSIFEDKKTNQKNLTSQPK